MFKLFKRKSEASAPRYTGAAETEEPTAIEPVKTFAKQDFENILRDYFRPGNSAAFYFAKCCGLHGDTLSHRNTDEFLEAILTEDPEDISFEGKRLGFSHFEREVTTSRQLTNMGWWSIHPNEQDSDPEWLQSFQQHCEENSITELETIFPEIDMVEEVFRYVETLRRNDLELMISEVERRREAIKRIFRPLRNRRINKYGDEDFRPELEEMQNLLDYAFERNEFFFFWQVQPLSGLLNYVESMLDEGRPTDEIPLDGIEFEHWCADRLREQGWDVVVSRASGDQGVDIMARREGVEVAIQCKRYTNPVGNKAVQEAFTGAQNEGAGHSCVIGTGGFTRSAEEIATTTGVHLVNAAEIGLFSSLFGFETLEELDPGNHREQEAGGGDDPVLNFRVSGRGGRYIGTLLVSLIESSGVEDCQIDAGVGAALLECLDVESGEGSFEVDRTSFAMLLVLAATGLQTDVQLHEANLASMAGSEFYDQDALAAYKGEFVPIKNILHQDLAEEAYQFLLEKAEALGPLFGPVTRDQISRVLFAV